MSPEELAQAFQAMAAATAQTPQQAQTAAATNQYTQANLAAKYQKDQEKAAKKQKKAGMLGDLGKVLGTVVGSLIPGAGPVVSAALGAAGGAAGAAAGGADLGDALAGYGAQALASAAPATLDKIGTKIGEVGGFNQSPVDMAKNQVQRAMFPGDNPIDNYGIRPVEQMLGGTTDRQMPSTLRSKFAESLQTGGTANDAISQLLEQIVPYSPTIDAPSVPMGLSPQIVADSLDRNARQREMDLRAAQMQQQMRNDQARLGMDQQRLGLEGKQLEQGNKRLSIEEQNAIVNRKAAENSIANNNMSDTEKYQRDIDKWLMEQESDASKIAQQLQSQREIAAANNASSEEVARIHASSTGAYTKAMTGSNIFGIYDSNNKYLRSVPASELANTTLNPGEYPMPISSAGTAVNANRVPVVQGVGEAGTIVQLLGDGTKIDTGLYPTNSDPLLRKLGQSGQAADTAQALQPTPIDYTNGASWVQNPQTPGNNLEALIAKFSPSQLAYYQGLSPEGKAAYLKTLQ